MSAVEPGGGRLDPAAALALAEAVLRLAEAEGATEAEVLVAGGDEALTRFANSEIHQNVAESDVRVNLRFARGKRIGVASSGRTHPEGLRRLVETAGRIAAIAEEAPDWAGLPAAGPAEPVEGAFARGTADATPELRAAGVRAVIAAADAAGVGAFGSFSTGVETVAIATTTGIRAAEARTAARLLTVTMGPDDGTGYAEAAGVDARAIDAAAVGREAAEKARRSARPVDLPPGDYPVVLEEYAVADLLDNLGFVGFSGLAVEEERSFFEPGKRVGSELVTIVDDARDPAGMPAGFDYEGVPTRRVVMVERGICREVVHDASTAARAGMPSTGHGLPAPNPWGPFPLHAAMSAGTTPRAELARGMQRGLLVTRFHYTNVVHGKLAIITGMTRDGTFLVEDGEIVGPVRNLRFTQSYLDALAAVEAVASGRRLLRGELGAVLVPAVRIGSWRFTGATARD
ncbi:MAG TPA: metallopeptidase TldD-related protein [Candidatus Nanopelagicales bacterium]|nr:metallopeptidase TldD-related protein [Candidatus Nanopelagicales bacterium]